MTWTAISATQTDADSPVDEDLTDAIRENLDHLFDGTSIEAGLVAQTSLASGAVGRAQLKSGVEQLSYVHSASPAYTASAWSSPGEYGFNVQPRVVNGNGFSIVSTFLYQHYRAETIAGFTDTGFSPKFLLSSTETTGYTRTVWIQMRYVQASPPHMLLDDQDHGAWLYRVVRKSDEAVMASWSAGDPPYWLRGFQKYGSRGKIHPGRFHWRPHPFVDDVPAWDPSEYEVRLYDLRHLNEIVEVRPKRDALAKFRAEAQSLVAGGVSHESIVDMERTLAADEAEETAGIASATSELASLPGALKQALDRIARSKRIKATKKSALAEAARRTASIRQASAARRLSRCRIIDTIKDDDRHMSIDLSRCTRCISSDKSNPERGRLPGIYTNSSDSPFLVRVMTT